MTNNEQNWHLNFLKHIFRSSKFPAPLNNRGQTSLCGQKLVWRYSLLPLATHIHEQEKWLLLWAKTCCCWKCCWHQMEWLCWKNNNILVLSRKFWGEFHPLFREPLFLWKHTVAQRLLAQMEFKWNCWFGKTTTVSLWNIGSNLWSQQVPILMKIFVSNNLGSFNQLEK